MLKMVRRPPKLTLWLFSTIRTRHKERLAAGKKGVIEMDEQQQSTTSESQKSNLNPLLIVVILIIIAAVGAMLWLGNSKNTNQAAKVVPTTTQAQEPTAVATQAASESATVAVAVQGGSYYFKPNEIKVKKGDKVKITFTNAGGIHDFVIDALNVKTERIANGKITTVEFVADKVGTFEYYCSVGNHKQMGMIGKLIVSQ